MWIEIILGLITVYVIWQVLKKPSNLPPGPWGLPLFGYLPNGTKDFHKKLKELQNQHGDIISWRIGTRLVIFLCNFKVTKEAFLGQNFVDRPDLGVFSFLEGDNPLGVLATSGIHWHSLRRFSLRHLRDLGMGKSKIVTWVQFEASEIVKEMKKEAGTPAPVSHALNVAILNVVWRMVADRRYEIEGKEIKQFEKLILEIQKSLSRMSIHDFFPWVRYILPTFLYDKLIKKQVQVELSDKMKNFFKDIIEEHQESLDKTNPRDYIDDYLIEMENQKSDPDSTMSVEDLIYMVADLFVAGSETTKATIHWGIFYMATYQNVQKRLQKEVDEALPKGTLATLEDKSRLPYLDAFIHETLRFSSFLPHGAPHAATNDTTLGGYFIPKGAMISPVSIFMHYDPRYFESPSEFRPERFLNSEGKFVAPKEGFLPFSVGRRQCLGESLARMELFIFLSTLIQNLNFEIPPGKKIDLNPVESPLLSLPDVKEEVLITIR